MYKEYPEDNAGVGVKSIAPSYGNHKECNLEKWEEHELQDKGFTVPLIDDISKEG